MSCATQTCAFVDKANTAAIEFLAVLLANWIQMVLKDCQACLTLVTLRHKVTSVSVCASFLISMICTHACYFRYFEIFLQYYRDH